jgi:hypothetical protein
LWAVASGFGESTGLEWLPDQRGLRRPRSYEDNMVDAVIRRPSV